MHKVSAVLKCWNCWVYPNLMFHVLFFPLYSGLQRNTVKLFPFLKCISFQALPCWFPLDFVLFFFFQLSQAFPLEDFLCQPLGHICVGNTVNLYMGFNYFGSYSVKQISAQIPATHLMNYYCVGTILIYIYNKKIVLKVWTFCVFYISFFIWFRLWDT